MISLAERDAPERGAGLANDISGSSCGRIMWFSLPSSSGCLDTPLEKSRPKQRPNSGSDLAAAIAVLASHLLALESVVRSP
jgi:hypothetical protein